jgi:ABC-type sugar transport system ATPase subunit
MIAIDGLSMSQGNFAIENVSLTVPQGVYCVLMGRSGCGKTTILEAICGLRPLVRGKICLDGRNVTALKPGERGIGYVPQDRALFPTMIVREQLAFALVLRRQRRDVIASRVEEMAQLLGIAHLLDRRPGTLSGGEAQRVALGRALAAKPSVLCLDEPLSALDEDTHDEICGLLDTVHHHTNVTVLHVTHSRREARQLGDCVFDLEGGAVREVDLGSDDGIAPGAAPSSS